MGNTVIIAEDAKPTRALWSRAVKASKDFTLLSAFEAAQDALAALHAIRPSALALRPVAEIIRVMEAVAYLNLVPVADYLAGEEASEMRHGCIRPKPQTFVTPLPSRFFTNY